MNRCGSVAARLPKSERLDLAVRALANSESITDLAGEHGVSRKFVYEQRGKASAGLDEAFAMDASDEEGLFDLKVRGCVRAAMRANAPKQRRMLRC